MTSTRRMTPLDLFRFNATNLDPLTETYNLSFYLTYMATWPDLVVTAVSPPTSTPVRPVLAGTRDAASTQSAPFNTLNKQEKHHEAQIMGYLMGKVEGEDTLWHAHVTALTVAPSCRRMGLARSLMSQFERCSEEVYDTYFVDLFVRASNALAMGMYASFGYSNYRRVLGYYTATPTTAEEDAWDMRKACRRDAEGKSVVPLGRAVRPDELEW